MLSTEELMLLNVVLYSRVPWTTKRSKQSLLREINIFSTFIGRTDTEAPILWPLDAQS